MPRTNRWLAAALLAALVLAACTAAATPSGPTVADAWVRPPMGPDRPAAGYLTITGHGTADALLSATSPVAQMVEIHETMAGASGMASMHQVDRIPVPAGGSVKLEPGGYHLMLMGLGSELAVGQKVQITLTFERAGEIRVEAEVRQG
jgi:copper(I)-binding protein